MSDDEIGEPLTGGEHYEKEGKPITDEEVAAAAFARQDAETTRAMELERTPEEREAAEKALHDAMDASLMFKDPESGESFVIPPADVPLDDSIAREDVEKGIHPEADEE